MVPAILAAVFGIMSSLQRTRAWCEHRSAGAEAIDARALARVMIRSRANGG
jgi:hypothetical protein